MGTEPHDVIESYLADLASTSKRTTEASGSLRTMVLWALIIVPLLVAVPTVIYLVRVAISLGR